MSTQSARPPETSNPMAVASALAPLVLLGALVYWFFNGGSKLIERPSPPIEEVSVRRVELTPGELKLTIRNTGPMPVDMTLVTVDEAIWKAEFSPGRHLDRFASATVRIPFDWVEGDPYKIALFTATGASFGAEVAVATATPTPTARMFWVFAAMGAYVGIIPVMLGILWLPFLRRLSPTMFSALLSLTLGLLVFLGIDALSEGLEAAHKLPDAFSGIAVVAIGFAAAILVISAVDAAARRRVAARGGDSALVLAYMIALGIGVHNLGEGLAIGGAYATGEIALGALLLIGFTIHNTTEGLAIVAPIARNSVSVGHLAALGLLGGAPAIAGCWLGGFTRSDVGSAFFLAIGAGAIFQVVWTIGRQMLAGSAGNLLRAGNAIGFMLGMLVMYSTALLVTA